MSQFRPQDVQSIPFRIRTFNYNRYYVNHPQVRGILNVANIVTNVGLIPENAIPPNQMPLDGPPVGLGYQPIVAFTNQGETHEPTEQPNVNNLRNVRRIELTRYIVEEENYEPWNEYVITGNPPRLLRTRTILVRVEWVIDVYNNFWDPYILVNHNTTYSVSNPPAPESGMP